MFFDRLRTASIEAVRFACPKTPAGGRIREAFERAWLSRWESQGRGFPYAICHASERAAKLFVSREELIRVRCGHIKNVHDAFDLIEI